MKGFHKHPTVRQLTEYSTGDLSLLARMAVELHVRTCSACAEKLVQLGHVVAQVRADTSKDSLSSIIDRVVRMSRSRKFRVAALSDLPRHVLAVLRFDSAGLAPAFGVRSGMPGTRQLLFNAGEDEIDLRIEPDGLAWTVSGQILGRFNASGKAVLLGATGTSETDLNEMSEFILTRIEAGTYRLLLKFATAEVEIQDIRIGS